MRWLCKFFHFNYGSELYSDLFLLVVVEVRFPRAIALDALLSYTDSTHILKSSDSFTIKTRDNYYYYFCDYCYYCISS